MDSHSDDGFHRRLSPAKVSRKSMRSRPPRRNKYRGLLILLALFLVLCLGIAIVYTLQLASARAFPTSASMVSDLYLPLWKQQQQQPQHQVEDTSSSAPITIAYAISLIQCGDHQSNPAGMSDAAAVLAHSIHKHSIRNSKNRNSSKYDYKLYAIVHEQAQECSHLLADIGYKLIVVPAPFSLDQLQDFELRTIMAKAWCCGHDEFIKLHAYNLVEHELVVHMDVDFLITQPMDDLFNVMLYDGGEGDDDSATLEAMRRKVFRETHSWLNPPDHWPSNIQAAFTRDWPQMRPGRIPGFQAGFIVLKPNRTIFDDILRVIQSTHYVNDFSRQNGWGGRGYGAYVGAAAMQGLLAYYYDTFHNESWIELNQCRYNHMGMDLLWRYPPNAPGRKHAQFGKCRNGMDDKCEDCQHTALSDIYSIHYTQCRKPWNCIGQGTLERPNDSFAIPEDSVVLKHCMELQRVWHLYRSEMENSLLQVAGGDVAATSIASGQSGDYKREVFQGHCAEYGGAGYLPMTGHDRSIMQRIPELYG